MKKYYLLRHIIISKFRVLIPHQILVPKLFVTFADKLLECTVSKLNTSLVLSLFMLSVYGCGNRQRDSGKIFRDVSFELPKPSGPFGVYRSKVEINLDKKRLILFIYQPSTDSLEKAFTFPEDELRRGYLPALQNRLGDKGGYAAAFSKMNFARKLLSKSQKFPVIFFSPGMNWTSLDYSYLIQELVSRGNIVIGINPEALSTLLYNSSRPALKKDMSIEQRIVQTDHDIKTAARFTLSNLLTMGICNADLDRVAFLGHSLGGASSLLAAMDLPGLKAVVNLDGDLLESSKESKPACAILFMCQFPDEDFNNPSHSISALQREGWRYENMRVASTKASQAYFIGINGLAHSDFLDASLIPRVMISPEIASDRFGRLDARDGLDLVAKNILLFLDASFDKNFRIFETEAPKGLRQRIFNLKTGFSIFQ